MHFTKNRTTRRLIRSGFLRACAALVTVLAACAYADDELAPLPLELPRPSFKGTPTDLPKGPHLEPFNNDPRAPFMAPKGVVNLALHKPATSSDKRPITGELSMVTDGEKYASDDTTLELHKGVQWVQIDLGKPADITAIVMWHDHRYVQAFRSVVVRASNDPDFNEDVRTLFNNDFENEAGLGAGTGKQYFETHQGKLIDTRDTTARYLRFYSRGSNGSALNCYIEIEVYGLPPK